MAARGAKVQSLAEEYRTIGRELRINVDDRRGLLHLREALVSKANWTSEGARELVDIARKYGAFMLRNALALAIALGIEDGTSGF